MPNSENRFVKWRFIQSDLAASCSHKWFLTSRTRTHSSWRLKDQEGSKHIWPNNTLQDLFLVGKGNCVWMSLWEGGSAVFVVPRFTAQLNSLHPSFVYEDASPVSNGIPSPFLCCFRAFSCTYSKIMKHTHLNP